MTWKEEFLESLPKLGHRNWIVLADAAFPEQSKSGMKVVLCDLALDDCLKYVMGELQGQDHVLPTILLDRELEFLSDDLCPGVDALRDAIKFETDSYVVMSEEHEVILEKLNIAGENYTIFVIKTPTTIPYTSIFLQLECGYWNQEKEAILRGRM